MSLQPHGRDDAVVTVTTARLSHSDDIALRERRYIKTQLVRVVCVILAVALPVPIQVKLLMFVGAVCLPWFGVVMANAGPTVTRRKRSAITSDLEQTLPLPAEPLALSPSRIIDAER